MPLVACGGVASPTRVAANLTPPAVGTYGHASPAELDAMLAQKDFVFVNVHTPYEGEITSTDIFIPYDEIGQKLERLPADKAARIVLYCRSGHMSTIAAQALVKLGYTNVWSLDGGMAAWERAGYTLVTGSR
jgi:rhodanese-related sulfurtransferase